MVRQIRLLVKERNESDQVNHMVYPVYEMDGPDERSASHVCGGSGRHPRLGTHGTGLWLH